MKTCPNSPMIIVGKIDSDFLKFMEYFYDNTNNRYV